MTTYTVQSIYTATGTLSNPTTATITDLLSSFLGSGALAGKGLTATGLDALSPGSLTAFENQHSEASNQPKAYLNYLLFDDQFRYVAGDLDPVNTCTVNTPSYKLHNKFITAPVNVTKNGYIYIYVSNESNLNVFFDNLTVTHVPGLLVEETHYYPFGLTMAGISSKAASFGRAENKYKYNKGSELQNKEFSDGSGLDWYATPLRSLDPQLGRWWQIDSKPDYAQSLYSAMGNNPILHNDPLGDTSSLPSYNNFMKTVPQTNFTKKPDERNPFHYTLAVTFGSVALEGKIKGTPLQLGGEIGAHKVDIVADRDGKRVVNGQTTDNPGVTVTKTGAGIALFGFGGSVQQTSEGPLIPIGNGTPVSRSTSLDLPFMSAEQTTNLQTGKTSNKSAVGMSFKAALFLGIEAEVKYDIGNNGVNYSPRSDTDATYNKPHSPVPDISKIIK